jgi:hypothetical protein
MAGDENAAGTDERLVYQAALEVCGVNFTFILIAYIV